MATEQGARLMVVSDIRFVKEFYPRIKESDAAIERYRASIDLLPPITVARGGILVDGYHRWQAHVREGLTEIAAEDLGNLSDAEILNEAIERNASHGHQLTAKDKKALAPKLWAGTAHMEKGERASHVAKILSVSERSVTAWTKDSRKAEKDELKAQAWALHLDCMSERRIAAEIGVTQPTVGSWVKEIGKSSLFFQAPKSAVYSDLWSFHSDDDEDKAKYFGKTPRQMIENLLWLYTDPGQIVFDPFAGSGTTIRVAKDMGRRVWSSDLVAQGELLPIHADTDITKGWPADAPKKADLIFLDPPYFLQARGHYPEHPDQAGEITDWDEWVRFWAAVVKSCKGRLKGGGHLAYIVSPTKVPGGKGSTVDNATEMLAVCRAAGFTMTRRYVVPYTTQQFTGDFVNKARKNRDPLIQIRDLVVMS